LFFISSLAYGTRKLSFHVFQQQKTNKKQTKIKTKTKIQTN
jgi:hypothetical protein